MNLIKATGTIGGLTMVSRIAGFAREMLMSRVMGASWQADAFFVAFRLPNTFRRLFGEGAFSAGFVPLYSQRLQGENGEVEAKKFSEEVLAVFVPTLIVFTLVFEIIMGPYPPRETVRANLIFKDDSGNYVQVIGPYARK